MGRTSFSEPARMSTHSKPLFSENRWSATWLSSLWFKVFLYWWTIVCLFVFFIEHVIKCIGRKNEHLPNPPEICSGNTCNQTHAAAYKHNEMSPQPAREFLARRLFWREIPTLKVVKHPPNIREFKKLRRQLQRKRHIKIKLCLKLSLLRLFHVDHVVQNRRTALSLAWYEWFSCKGKEWKIYCCQLALLSESQIWKFHVVIWQTTSKHCTRKRSARAARLFFFIQPIKSLFCGVVADVAVVKS